MRGLVYGFQHDKQTGVAVFSLEIILTSKSKMAHIHNL